MKRREPKLPASGFYLLNIPVIKRITAFGTELRRFCTLFRLPAAFVALILRNSGRLLGSAFRAELSFVDSSTGTGPMGICDTLIGRFRRTAFGTEFTACRRAALAGPAVCRFRFRFLRAAFGAELSGSHSTTGALPAILCRCRCRYRLLLVLLSLDDQKSFAMESQ